MEMIFTHAITNNAKKTSDRQVNDGIVMVIIILQKVLPTTTVNTATTTHFNHEVDRHRKCGSSPQSSCYHRSVLILTTLTNKHQNPNYDLTNPILALSLA